MSWDVILYDGNGAPGAFSPTLNASRPTGGTEVHMVQIAEAMARAGKRVLGISAISEPDYSAKAEYEPIGNEEPAACKLLITSGLSRVPNWITPDRHVVLWTHDPRHNIPHIGHLRWSELICVSHWQARHFPYGWKTRVIPAMVDDWIYDLPPIEKNPKKFVCVSAWWKGTPQTLLLWEQTRPAGAELHVGSPYSHPPNAKAICERVPGVKWLDVGNPSSVVEAMRDAAGTFRACASPETFGATDVIAQILGCRTHVFTMDDPGALAESLAPTRYTTSDLEQFRRAFIDDYGSVSLMPHRDYRPSKVIPEWLKFIH